ncbi:MAG: hypothetical protein QGH20_01895 [Candidatus Latescibacteria bacterium]|nr:hypothetical protein [Candidatus Latescibacterota bacterium]
MNDLIACIEALQAKLQKHRDTGLNETSTRTIFIDPMLRALGWDVTEPTQVDLEYSIFGGGNVDYALMINGKPTVLVEAKPLHTPADDKAVAQAVSYSSKVRSRVVRAYEWGRLCNLSKQRKSEGP